MGLLYSNYECNPQTKININSVNGTLTKNYIDSYFDLFEIGDEREYFYLNSDKPSRILEVDHKAHFDGGYHFFRGNYYKLKDVVVLQVMLCGENKLLAEIIDKDKFYKKVRESK